MRTTRHLARALRSLQVAYPLKARFALCDQMWRNITAILLRNGSYGFVDPLECFPLVIQHAWFVLRHFLQPLRA